MLKKITAALVLLLLACGTVCADDADDADEETAMQKNIDEEIVMPKNIIAVDVGPTGYFLLFTGVGNLINPDTPMYAIGIAAQYERQIIEKASAAVRFEYGMVDMSDKESKWRMSAIVAEGHGRYYPGQGVFFLDGTLGYAYVFTDFSSADREVKPDAHYFKFGGKLGWRIDFKKPGGFILEPALGYYGAVGTELKLGYEEDVPILGSILDFLTDSLAKGLFVGGFRFSLGLGYRF